MVDEPLGGGVVQRSADWEFFCLLFNGTFSILSECLTIVTQTRFIRDASNNLCDEMKVTNFYSCLPSICTR